MTAAAVYHAEFKSRPTPPDNAAAERMQRRMYDGAVYTLGRTARMKLDRSTRLFQLQNYDPAAEDMIVVAASGDGKYIALLGLVNYDRSGWVAQTAAEAEQADQPQRANRTRIELLRFSREDEAHVYYLRSRSLRRTVSPPFQNAHGVWCVTYIHRRA